MIAEPGMNTEKLTLIRKFISILLECCSIESEKDLIHNLKRLMLNAREITYVLSKYPCTI